jgi:hypothetical protein
LEPAIDTLAESNTKQAVTVINDFVFIVSILRKNLSIPIDHDRLSFLRALSYSLSQRKRFFDYQTITARP